MSIRLSLAAIAALCLLAGAGANPFGSTFAGEGTYYGFRDRGFGHCSFHFLGLGKSPGYAGTPLAINSAQYTGTSVCGLCVRFRGKGHGAGGNPISQDWQPGFICDQCPECKYGDLDLQWGGDGRWKIEWEPVQCPVGGTTFKFGFQGGNPWYKKIQVANARVPISKVEIKRNGYWQQLVATIDNYHEYHGTEAEAFNEGGCARLRLTSILGDSVEDRLCCTSGSCDGGAQLPCRSDMKGDCGGSRPLNNGGNSYFDNKRLATGAKQLVVGEQCGGTGFACGKMGGGQCQDKPFSSGAACVQGLKCVRNDAAWWGCKKA